MQPSSFKTKKKKPDPIDIQGLALDNFEGLAGGVMPKMTASRGIFAPDPSDYKGALGGVDMGAGITDAPAKGVGMASNLVKAPMPEKPKQGAGLLDYLGLAGATLSQMGNDGRPGSINDFMDRRTTAAQQSEMDGLLEGLDLSPEELGLVKAGMGRDVLAKRVDDGSENKRDARNRAYTVEDRAAMRGFDLSDAATARNNAIEDREDGQMFDQGQFDRTMAQDQSQHEATIGLGRENMRSDERIADATIKQKGEKQTGWTPAGLMNTYNKNIAFVDEQEKMLSDMAQVAAESQAFQKTASNFDSIGPGIDKSIGRFFSGLTGGDANTLDRNTKSISALMKKPGGGAWTDADQKVAESYAVNAANTPEANQYAAAIASNRERRQRAYVDFLRESVDPEDPTSLQQAKQLWSAYAQENPMFTPNGDVNDTAQQPSVEEWMQSAMQGGPQGGAPVRINSEEERRALPPGTQYMAPDGSIRVAK